MDPFLERASAFHDFHERFVPRIADALTPSLRPKYITRVDENVYVHELSCDERVLLGRPDVFVLERDAARQAVATSAKMVAPAYGQVPPATDQLREAFVKILDRETQELVAVIELLSPTNKNTGPDRMQYLAKRNGLLSSSVHFVEIDLLRAGPRMPIDDLPPCDYCIMVSRSEERPRVELWPVGLRERLPEIPIPLQFGDPDARLDLQLLLNHQYEAAGYEDYIYDSPLLPPLSPDDAVWAEQRKEERC
jgi:hypothetical protein